MQRLTRGVRTKVVLFVVLALAGTSYVGASYVGFNPFDSGYRITVSLPEAGGLFENAEVTYRGVPVGEVAALTPTGDGVDVTVEIDADAPRIPADSVPAVANRSAIGEQYLDLRGSSGGQALAEGAHLVGGADALPPDIAAVLRTARDLSGSVPSDALNTVIDEGYLASQGVSDDLRQVVRTTIDFQQAADRNFMVSASLIRNSERVLRTQEESADALRSYSNDLRLFATTLAGSDGDLRALILNSPAAAREISALIDDVGRPLGILMSNLVSTASVFGTNAAGIEDAMIRVPEVVSIGHAVASSGGLRISLVPTFFNPPACEQGYGGTQRRQGTNTSDGRPLNTGAGCTQPRSQGNVRGPQHLPDAELPSATAVADIRVADSLADLMGGR